MKVLMTIFVMSLLTSFSYAGDKGNGGGGIVRDGRYMTFYSAGFYIEPYDSETHEVPELDNLINFFDVHPTMSDHSKIKYVSALIPSDQRKYFKVKADKFTDEVRDSLLAEFSRVSGANTNELAIFAITDTTSQTTYLLPEFYKLSVNDQKTILFHEAYWILNPKASYDEVVDAEISFQAHLENPSSLKRLVSFVEKIGSKSDLLRTIITHDLANNSMGKLAKRGKIFTNELVGQKFITCRMQYESKVCYDFVTKNLYDLSRRYPNSLFLDYLFQRASEKKMEIEVYGYNYDYSYMNPRKPRNLDTRVRAYPVPENNALSTFKKCKFFNRSDSIDLMAALSPTEAVFQNVVKRSNHCASQALIILE